MLKTTTVRQMAVNPDENREKFLARVEPYLSRKEFLDVRHAYIISKYGHRWQSRKEKVEGIPKRYFEHPRDGALVVLDELGLYRRSIILSILLHDCPEDTEIDLELIEHLFGSEVTRIVKLLTNDQKTLQLYIQRFLIAADWQALMAKCIDILINTRTWADREMAMKQLQKVEEYKVIAGIMCEICPSALRGKALRLCGLINRALEEAQKKFQLPGVPTYGKI
jgi:(p)ppGpp synthase/HD superfamily hydrolase